MQLAVYVGAVYVALRQHGAQDLGVGRICARTGQDCPRCDVFQDGLLAVSAVRHCYPRSRLFHLQPEQATFVIGSVKTVMRILCVQTVGSA